MKINFDKKEYTINGKITVSDFVASQNLEKTVLAVKRNNTIVKPEYIIKDGDVITPITISDDEGYLIYKETLIIVLLHAAETLSDCSAVFIRQSVNKSTYFEIECNDLTKEESARRIKDKMRAIIESGISINQKELSKNEVSELFESYGDSFRAKEISLLPAGKIRVCETAKRCHITYQPLAYSIKAVDNFDVQPYKDGFLLKYPTNYTVDKIPEINSGIKVHQAIEDYRDWITTIGAEDIFSLNSFIQKGKASDIVNLSEGLHEKRISRIADHISRNSDIRVILIAGPSSSGKTTFANRLCLHLRINHIEPIVISLDDYYVNDDRMPRDEKGDFDFECVESIDYELFNEHLSLLTKGESVEIPKYDFNIRHRVKGKKITLDEGQILIVEGIHALNELLTSRVDRKNKYKIYLSALTSLCLDEYNAFSPTDNRLIRRMVRDAQFRNTPAEYTFKLWKSVRRGEQKYIFPFESEADEVFNSSLVYELSVLKEPAVKLLDTIGEDSEYYSKAIRLKELLSFFETMNPDCIPPTSIIREFIGGSTLV